jgi:D-tyrosyl-tRNA(Tyr) deacylase
MRALIQRVSHAHVEVEQKKCGEINKGLLIFLGIEEADDENDAVWLLSKIIQLRIFNDSENKMNASLRDIDGKLLIVSQFTLHAQTKKGNRPSFIRAAHPEKAKKLYEHFISLAEKELGVRPETGIFGANMEVHLCNDGPVTIWMDTKNRE